MTRCGDKMYENYIFDLYGTLLDIRTNENKPYLWKKMSEIYSALGAVYSPGELKCTFRELEQSQIRTLPENGEPDLRKVFAELFCKKGCPSEEQRVRDMAITFRALSRQKLCVYEGVKECLQTLKERGKGVYLLSNAQTDFTRPEIAMMGLESYFDAVLISSEEGYKKPAKEFYEILLHRYSLKPQESLMVGNDEGSDIAGAAAVGMDTLYIHTEISPQITGESKATYVVSDGDWSKVRTLLCDSLLFGENDRQML